MVCKIRLYKGDLLQRRFKRNLLKVLIALDEKAENEHDMEAAEDEIVTERHRQ